MKVHFINAHWYMDCYVAALKLKAKVNLFVSMSNYT